MKFLSALRRPAALIKSQSKTEEEAGLSAKINAELVRQKASSDLVEAKALSSKAQALNYRNHFSEGLGEAFSRRGRTT